MITRAYGSTTIHLGEEASLDRSIAAGRLKAEISGEATQHLRVSVHVHKMVEGVAAEAVCGNTIDSVSSPATADILWQTKSNSIRVQVAIAHQSIEFETEVGDQEYLLNFVVRDRHNELLYAYGIPLDLETGYERRDAESLSGPTIRICAPNIVKHDAVGHFCRDLSAVIANAGWPVQLYADVYSFKESRTIRKYSELFADIRPDDIIFINYSIFDPLLERVVALPNKKICYFHNVTPSTLLAPWDEIGAAMCQLAEEQIARLQGCDEFITQSQFSANYLNTKFSQSQTVLLAPPLLRQSGETPPSQLQREESKTVLLFVGRIAPNKCIDDLLRIYSSYRQLDRSAELVVAGSLGTPSYMSHLDTVSRDLHLAPTAMPFLQGSITDDALRHLYAKASVFVCMSEHEGFCVPVLEAMEAGLPIVYTSQPAVQEVLGESGVQVQTRDPDAIAKIIYNLVNDEYTREHIIEMQRRRAAEIGNGASGADILRTISKLAGRETPPDQHDVSQTIAD